MGVDSKCEIFKSNQARKFYYTVTYFDRINGVVIKRSHPNVVSEHFKTKKSLVQDDYYLKYRNRIL